MRFYINLQNKSEKVFNYTIIGDKIGNSYKDADNFSPESAVVRVGDDI